MNVSNFLRRIKEAGLLEETLRSVETSSGIPRSIILAIVYVESSGRAKAIRYEKDFKWLHLPQVYSLQNLITEDTERFLQKCSFGLMQVMGGTARSECGYIGHLINLFDPNLNLHTSVHYLAKLKDKYISIEDAISAYNQGSPRKKMMSGKYKNQNYVDKVLRAAWELGYRSASSKTS